MASVIDTIHRLSDSSHDTVRNAYLFGLSRQSDPVAFLVTRELWLNLGRVLSASLAAILFCYFDVPKLLWLLLAFASVAQLGWLYLRRIDALFETPISLRENLRKTE